jgi:outer membrane protein OmpA-like peptidoglycan-associated protein
LHINNLGAYFSVSAIERKTDEILLREPQMQMSTVVKPAKPGQWVKVSGTFKATYEAEHLLIGNFSDDNNTISEVPGDDAYNYAYYYIDDVVVKKIPPFLAVPVKADDLTRIPLEKGKTIPLKNIYFEFDKDELLPRSYVELHKLLKILKETPSLSIEVVGHTDNLGNDNYNLELSRHRALAVVDFLRSQGVSGKRLGSRGEGESKPIATNDTEEGRAQNRRVEFVVLKR